MKIIKNISTVSAGLLILAGSLSAAPTYKVVGVSKTSTANTKIGESQISVGLVGLSSSQIKIVVSNNGPSASSIADIYLGGTSGLLVKKQIINGSGVAYSWGATPGNLPGGTSKADISADSNPPVSSRGINPGESVSLVFNIVRGKSLETIVSAIECGSLKVGMHVQAFKDGKSECFEIDRNPPVVPAPGTLILASVGIGVVGYLKRRHAV